MSSGILMAEHQIDNKASDIDMYVHIYTGTYNIKYKFWTKNTFL